MSSIPSSNLEFEDAVDQTCLAIAKRYCRPQPMPCRTSDLTGASYVHEVLRGHAGRAKEMLRMKVDVFQKLCESLQNYHGLQATRGVDVDEQVEIFFFICGQNASSRLTQERFQHSGDTIHWNFKRVLQALVELHTAVVTMPTADDPISADIARSRKFFPYFRDFVGALDGTHIPIHVPAHRQTAFHNRKGFLIQNVLAACRFDLSFCYVLAVWEGSAHDGCVLQDSRTKGFIVPSGKYFLGDAGYGISNTVLTPYRGVEYNLKEWGRPQNAEELFNLRHSSLRNAVERIFGVLRKRFPILAKGCQYPVKTQVQLVYTLTIHNFIIKHSGEYELFEEPELISGNDQGEPPRDQSVSVVERREAAVKRENIAKSMWEDYISISRVRNRQI
ncbi:hypothetical protein PsorP6_004473 [Peronosclerospora sorghi]|uniref:Uncharacterized protein n=1 Tax=Peronosclerospora sorghi TaxID=230839 RepID=A0ACC0VJ59_9STRA|nr:hypothetical protein PsorP6_004473 [Peronosclerospora sorghi]